MQAFVIVTFITVLSAAYLASRGWIPQPLVYLPELFGAVAAAIVVIVGTRTRFRFVDPIYWLLFGAILVLTLMGAIANHMEPGPVFAGLRIYLRAIPFFFLPAVLLFDDRQLRTQLAVLLFICLLQLPLTLDQRWATMVRGSFTGDYVFGTLMNSGQLSIFLVGATAIVIGLVLRRMISTKAVFILLLLLLLPTMLNETKVTLVAVPLMMATCFIVGAKPGERVKNTILAVVIAAVFLAAFIPIYDYFMKPKWGYGLVDFIFQEGRVEGYLDRGAKVGEYDGSSGKLGGLKIALTEVSRNPVNLVFGFGIGNVGESALGDQFTGYFFKLYNPFLETTATFVVFEFGITGLILLLLLFGKMFRDCLYVAHADSRFRSAIAIGVAGIVMTLLLGFFYHKMHENRAISILFWYLTGTVAAFRMRLAYRDSNDSPEIEAKGDAKEEQRSESLAKT